MTDSYTTQMRLCDNRGYVSDEPVQDEFPTADTSYLARHNRLRNMSLRARGEKPQQTTVGFMCTGSAHLAGEHIRCTSPIHQEVSALR